MIKLKVPATSANLGPGFDCLGIALKIYNYYTFKKIKDKEIKFNFINNITGEEIKLEKKNNLTYRAIKDNFDLNFGIEIQGKISIPIARGLGSSAAAIIAGIVGTNFLTGHQLSENNILERAINIEGHPDNIAPAYWGGFNINLMTDNGLINKRFNIEQGIKIILIIPAFKISTNKLRGVLPGKVSFSDAVYNHSRTALLTACFYEGDWDNLSTAMEDRLHQDYRAKFIPGFYEIIKTSYLNGALGVALSGSGPTILIFANSDCHKIGKAIVKVFKTYNIESDYLITEPDNEGIKIY